MKTRKRYQRYFNRKVHQLNRSIENDDLWRGRFVMFQKDAWFETFPHDSEGLFHAVVRVYDKATGYYKDYTCDAAPWLKNGYFVLWKIMNDFITEDAAAWSNDNIDPREDKINYNYINIPLDIFKKDLNFYCSMKYFDKN